METISRGNGVRLTEPGSAPGAPFDIDFHDVFGGPPRRSSIQDIRMHSYASEDDTDDERNRYRSSWSGVDEKPVFGGENVNRRRYTNDCFFDDIFKVEESSRKNEREAYPSSPGARGSSPARHLPSKPELFGTSLPAQFSLPANLSNGVDLPAFVSAAHGTNHSSISNASPSRSSSESIKVPEELRQDVRSYHPSPMSQEFSASSDGSPVSTRSDKSDKGERSRRNFSSENMKSNVQFHFSIYKWAGKGVPSLIPVRSGRKSRLNQKSRLERSSSSGGIADDILPTEAPENQNIPSSIDGDRASGKSFRKKPYNQEDRSQLTQNLTQEAVVIISETEFLNSHDGDDSDISCKDILQNAEKKAKSHSSERVLSKKSENEISVEIPKPEKKSIPKPEKKSIPKPEKKSIPKPEKESIPKPEKKSLSFLFYDKEDRLGSGKIKKANVEKRTKDEKGSTQSTAQVDKLSKQGSLVNTEDKQGIKKVKGKVKDFVNIFNQDTTPRTKINVKSSDKSTKQMDERTSVEEKKANVVISGTDEKLSVPDANSNEFSPAASRKVDEYLRKSENHHTSVKRNDHIFSNASSGQGASSASYKASVSDGSKATSGVSKESFSGELLVEDLTQAEDKVLQASDGQEESREVIDNKIRKWSNGKEGNIRSLLSTLQYVLWPESGWKPVPLVDIIEASAVKRSYQKALLCLHPDKLQQKGAASHQKYIAEKVFEILQEAWNHFSTFTSL